NGTIVQFYVALDLKPNPRMLDHYYKEFFRIAAAMGLTAYLKRHKQQWYRDAGKVLEQAINKMRYDLCCFAGEAGILETDHAARDFLLVYTQNLWGQGTEECFTERMRCLVAAVPQLVTDA